MRCLALFDVANDLCERGVQLSAARARGRRVDGAREQRIREFDPSVGTDLNHAFLLGRTQIGNIHQRARRLRQCADPKQRVACSSWQLSQPAGHELAQIVGDRQR